MKHYPPIRGRVAAAVERHTFGDIDMPNLPAALCQGHDPELWFNVPHKPSEKNTVNPDAAKAILICNECPEQAACLDWAVSHDEEHGIWGGLLPIDRYEIKRRTA